MCGCMCVCVSHPVPKDDDMFARYSCGLSSDGDMSAGGQPAFQSGCLTKKPWKGTDIFWDTRGRTCSDQERKKPATMLAVH